MLKRQDLLYPQLSYQIIGILFDVSNSLEYGYQERYYQKAIAVKMKELNVNFQEQAPIKIKINDDSSLGIYFLDFIVEGKIVLEIKKEDKFLKKNIEQIFAYLKATNLKLGILANFTKKGLQFKRIVNINNL